MGANFCIVPQVQFYHDMTLVECSDGRCGLRLKRVGKKELFFWGGKVFEWSGPFENQT